MVTQPGEARVQSAVPSLPHAMSCHGTRVSPVGAGSPAKAAALKNAATPSTPSTLVPTPQRSPGASRPPSLKFPRPAP